LAARGRVPVVLDINVIVDAVVIEPDPAQWKTPPPVQGEPAVMTLAVLNEGLEFGLWLSPHILEGTRRVLRKAFHWEPGEVDAYEAFLSNVASRTGGLIKPATHVADCADWEDNRVLELADAAGAFLIVSSDDDLLGMSPWRGIPILDPMTFVSRVDAVRRRGSKPRRRR
jgi:predicted nucleic acid-binding protein